MASSVLRKSEMETNTHDKMEKQKKQKKKIMQEIKNKKREINSKQLDENCIALN